MAQKKPNWNFAPPDAEAGCASGPQHHAAWYKRDGKREVWQICEAAGISRWTWMGGRVDFPIPHELRPNPKHVHNLTIGPWDGEGLPPVGTVCEAINHRINRVEVTIRYVGEERVIAHDGNNERCFLIKDTDFHRIRTPEQIAAEERESNILELADELSNYQERETGHSHKKLAGYLYDHGYRKQVTP